jgi:hypothetical protein
MRRPSRGARQISTSAIACFVAAASIAGQSPQPNEPAPGVGSIRPAGSTVPRTPDGRPDLQGMWDFAQLTPLERPSEFAAKESLTEEEAEAFAERRRETTHKDRRDGTAAEDLARAYNDFWWDFGTRIAKQPSLVVDPPDGRIPPLTAEAQQRVAARQNRFDHPEERPLAERCILGFNSGPPMVPGSYNNYVQIVQTRDFVVIVNEMIHSARIVALNGRPHAPPTLRFLTGDSVGRWDGDTLVVDTTNFSQDFGFRGASSRLHLVERFTRVDRDTLRYEFTVDDPTTWTRSWSASIPMTRTDDQMFEYACHEANYALEGVLRGARYQEQQSKPK